MASRGRAMDERARGENGGPSGREPNGERRGVRGEGRARGRVRGKRRDQRQEIGEGRNGLIFCRFKAALQAAFSEDEHIFSNHRKRFVGQNV